MFICHGFGEHCSRYEKLGNALADQGCLAFSHDHGMINYLYPDLHSQLICATKGGSVHYEKFPDLLVLETSVILNQCQRIYKITY